MTTISKMTLVCEHRDGGFRAAIYLDEGMRQLWFHTYTPADPSFLLRDGGEQVEVPQTNRKPVTNEEAAKLAVSWEMRPEGPVDRFGVDGQSS